MIMKKIPSNSINNIIITTLVIINKKQGNTTVILQRRKKKEVHYTKIIKMTNSVTDTLDVKWPHSDDDTRLHSDTQHVSCKR